MSTHFAELLDGLQQRCLALAGMAQAAVREAVVGLLAKDPTTHQRVNDIEERIDAEEVELERQAINLLALHQPAGGDLRAIFAIVKMNADLERIADCAVNIAQQVGSFAVSGLELPADMRIMAETTLKQLDDTVRTLANKDPDLAEQVARGDDMIDALYNQLLQELQREMVAHSASVPGGLALFMMARNFERIGDHCTNIAEDVLYRMRGRIVRHSHDPR